VSFERILNPDNKLSRHSLFAPYIDKVEVRDASTVVFRMKKPLGSFLNHLSHIAGAIISPASLKKFGKDIARNPVGTGPFMFKEWVSGDHVTLVKHAGYWGEKAKLDELVMRPIPEGSARLLALETGEVDLVYPVPVTDIERLKKSSDLEVVVGPTNRVIFIGIKTTKKPYDDVRVRQALNYAVDKKALADKILMGYARVADSPVAPLTTGYSKTYSYDFNPEKAKQLLREAGIVPGTKIDLWTPQGRYPMDRQVAEVIQSNLTAVGFEVNLQRWEWAAYNKELRAKEKSNYGLYLLGSLPSTNDVNQALYNHFYTGLADNFYLYSNPTADKLLLEAQAEPNAGKRKALFDQVQKLITDEAPRIFLFSVDQAIGIRKGVKGVRIWPIELITFETADKVQ